MRKKQITSAGVVYFHLCGKLLQNDKLCLKQTNSYCYFEQGFYLKVKENLVETQCEDDAVHVFGVVGEADKVDMIQQIVVRGIRDNVQRIIDGKKLKKKDCFLDSYGNTFYQLIQEYFYEEIVRFPLGENVRKGECTAYYVYAGDLDDQYMENMASSMVGLWLEAEQATLFGKQLMIRSFFMRDFVDRKVVACVPSKETEIWNIVLEGGIKIAQDSEMSYSKEVLSHNDLDIFTIASLGDLSLETVYAFGKTYYPRELCAEWQKVFLFLCAIQEKEWDINSFYAVYENFLSFLEENICYMQDVSTFVSKEQGLRVLLRKVEDIKKFLQGKEENVISKDLLQTLSSRYVYIPYLMELFPVSESAVEPFSRVELEHRLNLAYDRNIFQQEKGRVWEDVTAYIIEHIKGWKISGRRIRTGHQEIDISVSNVSYSDELWELGAYILVECKNWCERVGVSVVRNIAYNSMMKGNRTALLFAANGITKDAWKEILRLAVNHIYILNIGSGDLINLSTDEDCTNLILDKWRQLQKSVENELPI